MADEMGTLNKNRFAAKTAQRLAVGSLLAAGSLQLPPAAAERAEQNESIASPASQFNSAQQRARRSNIDLDSLRPSVNSAYDPTEEDSAAQDDYVSNWLASQQENMDSSELDDYNPVRAQSRLRASVEDFARQQTSSTARKIGEEVYAAIPALLGDCDTPCEDGGITLGGAGVTSAFQLVRTFSSTASESVDKTGLGKALPPAFNTRSIIGWGQIVNAAFVLLWASGPGLILLFFAFIVVAGVAGVTGTAIYGAYELYTSIFG
jgi:hypothetical protein